MAREFHQNSGLLKYGRQRYWVAKHMIFWNPLFEVSLSETSISFSDERGSFQFNRPAEMKNWGILNDMKLGLSSHNLKNAGTLEQSLIEVLAKRNLIVELAAPLSYLMEERDAGHYLTFDSHPISAMQKLRSSVVCILGVGGVGSVVLQHLVALGVRYYVFVDNDVVEASNFNRQFIYMQKDIGKPKVDAATEFVHSRIKNAQVTSFKVHVDSIESLDRLSIGHCDIIVNCLDTPRQTIDDIVYGYGLSNGIAVTTAGVGVLYGHWGPLICPGDSNATYDDWKSRYLTRSMEKGLLTNAEPTPWSFGPTNTLIAANQAREVAEWLGGKVKVNSLSSRQVHRFSDNKVTSYEVRSPELRA